MRTLGRVLHRTLGSLNGFRSFSSFATDAKDATPRLKRKLGQHILVSNKLLEQITAAAELPIILSDKQSRGEDKDTVIRVLEIGPGTGNLTAALLAASPAVHVHAIEFDHRMVPKLEERFEQDADRLTIECKDFEDFQFSSTENNLEDKAIEFDACVANIPYQLSSLVISRLLTYMQRNPTTFRSSVLLVQDEFALRLMAKPGDQNYTRLSVNTGLIADVSSVRKVSRSLFIPPPKVDSRVVKLVPSQQALLPDVSKSDSQWFQRFDSLLRICFHRKNKTLRALLLSKTAKAQMILPDTMSDDMYKSTIEDILEACDLQGKRAVQLPSSTFMQLLETFESYDIHIIPSDTRHFHM